MYREGPPQALLPMGVNFHSEALVQVTDSESWIISVCCLSNSSVVITSGSVVESSQETSSIEVKKIAMRFMGFVFSRNEGIWGFVT